MSIQSDRWIREQAVKHRMIEPFSEKQVREGRDLLRAFVVWL
jgi:dCTP deaminase